MSGRLIDKEGTMTTGASGTIIETTYQGCPVRYEQETSIIDGLDLSLGMTEATLLEPIDYDAELAGRRETHGPHSDPEGSHGNSAFGI
jgi:hypothetical protein